MARALVAVVFCGVFFAFPAPAQQRPPADSSQNADALERLFQNAGLFGTWALDCAQPASPTNPRVNVSAPTEGLVMEVHDLGPDASPNIYSVLTAERQGGDRVAVEVLFQPGTETEQKQKLIIQVRKDSRRTLFNQPEGGAVRVKDGVVVGTTFKTPTLKKCG